MASLPAYTEGGANTFKGGQEVHFVLRGVQIF